MDNTLFFILAFSLLLGFAGIKIAESKNRRPGLWFVLCFLFGIIATIILVLLPALPPG